MASALRFLVFSTGLLALTAGCGSKAPTGPSTSSQLPLLRETATMRVYAEAGDQVDTDWQEHYNTWALGQLGLQPTRKVEYRKYLSREAMGRYTGNFSTNGYAEPAEWRFHTIWSRDNHEIIHVYTAPFGRPSDFFNEGIAVAFQTDPVAGVFAARFNGQDVHEACRAALSAGVLPLPLSGYVTTTPFRSIQDQVLSYRYAGSFVRFLIERQGLPAVLEFFRQAGGRDESLAAIRARTQHVFGRSLEDLETAWLAMLRG